MDNQEKPHKRRVRYSGTHPKTYKEKYKELQPEKYAEDVAKVIERGSTPAGMHRSICVNEIMSFLQIAQGKSGLMRRWDLAAIRVKCLLLCTEKDTYMR